MSFIPFPEGADGTIVVAVRRGEPADDTLALGIDLARATGASLLVAGAYLIGAGTLPYPYSNLLRDETAQELLRLAALVPNEISVDTKVMAATSVVRSLHDCAEDAGADILVIGPTHLGHAQRALMGDVTLGLFHAAPCAVAIAPAGYAERDERDWARIGVAWNATPESGIALDAAAAIARRLGARLTVIRALEWGDLVHGEPGLDPEGVDHYLAATRQELTAEAQDASDQLVDVDADVFVADGAAEDLLVDRSHELDLLVMGSRGFGPVRRVILSSVSPHVVHRAACPVLVLPRGVAEPAPHERRAAVASP